MRREIPTAAKEDAYTLMLWASDVGVESASVVVAEEEVVDAEYEA
jgi:hypothetical protein